jgi:hypothetical protein
MVAYDTGEIMWEGPSVDRLPLVRVVPAGVVCLTVMGVPLGDRVQVLDPTRGNLSPLARRVSLRYSDALDCI